MKLLLILLLIGLYSCGDTFDDIAGRGPYVIYKAETFDNTPGQAYRYVLYGYASNGYSHQCIIYSDSLWHVGDTLKLVKK